MSRKRDFPVEADLHETEYLDDHELSRDCWCRPTIVKVDSTDNVERYTVKHDDHAILC